MTYSHSAERRPLELREIYRSYEEAVREGTDRALELIQRHIDKSLLKARDPEFTKDLYEIREIIEGLTPERLLPTKPPGPPTITYAAPSPQGPGGEIEDPLAELDEEQAP